MMAASRNSDSAPVAPRLVGFGAHRRQEGQDAKIPRSRGVSPCMTLLRQQHAAVVTAETWERQTDRQKRDRCFTFTAMSAASVTRATVRDINHSATLDLTNLAR